MMGVVAVKRESDENVIKIGVIGPFTGPAARVGEEFKGATQMAFEGRL